MIDKEEMRAARQRARLSQQELANLLDVSLRTVGNWERGATVPRNREARLREVLAEHLRAVEQGPEQIDNPVTYDNLDPRLNNIERQIDALWRRLEELGAGQAEVLAPTRPDHPQPVRLVLPHGDEESFAGPDPETYLTPLAADEPGTEPEGQQLRDDQDAAGEHSPDTKER